MMRHDSPIDPDRGSIVDPDDDQQPEEIRVEIEQTRTEMSGTIDAIQRRLAPETLTAQAKDVARDAADQAQTAAREMMHEAVREVKEAAREVTEHAVHEVKEAAREVTVDAKDAAWDATVGRAEDAVSNAGETAKGLGATVIDTIKQNPVPAALAGISLAWLYTKRSSWQSSATIPYSRGPAQAYPARSTYESSWGADTAYDSRRTPAGDDSRSTVGAITDSVTDAASQAGEKVSDVASSAGQMASNAASSAGQMVSSAGETAVDTGSDLLSLIRANPIPSALVGLGLGWLYMNRSSGRSDYSGYSADRYRYNPEAAGRSRAYGSQGSYGTQGSYGSEGGVGDMARQAGDRASDLASGLTEQAGDLASSVGEQAGEMADAVMDRTRRAPGQLQRMIEENPMVTAALAATVGGAVGLALPSTRTEDRLVGKPRDRMMGRAQEMTSEAMDKVQSVAQEVQTSATKEARTQGLTV